MDECAGLEDNEFLGFQLFPNPSSDIVTISFNSLVDLKTIVLYDSQGKMIMWLDGLVMSNAYQVNIDNLSTGIYYLELRTDHSVLREKIQVSQ